MTSMLFVTYDDPGKGGQSDVAPPTTDEGTGSDRMDAANVVTSGQAARAAEELSERDQSILGFERQWWRFAGAKEQAIRETFDMSATRYYQVLNALIDREAALAYDPLLVKRLRRLRTARQRARSARRLGIEL
jgi:Protein of unknown function (DUF3263)